MGSGLPAEPAQEVADGICIPPGPSQGGLGQHLYPTWLVFTAARREPWLGWAGLGWRTGLGPGLPNPTAAAAAAARCIPAAPAPAQL